MTFQNIILKDISKSMFKVIFQNLVLKEPPTYNYRERFNIEFTRQLKTQILKTLKITILKDMSISNLKGVFKV